MIVFLSEDGTKVTNFQPFVDGWIPHTSRSWMPGWIPLYTEPMASDTEYDAG